MVKFKNIELTNLLKVLLNKEDEIFNEKELLSIDELILNAQNFADEFDFVEISELTYFKNLKSLKISNMEIKESDIKFLESFKSLDKLSFECCNFEKCDKLKELNLEKLTLKDCVIDSEKFIYDIETLKELNVVNGFLNFSKLNRLKSLKILNVSGSTIVEADTLELPMLENFIMDFSNITDLVFIMDFSNLRKVSLSRNQIRNNRKTLEVLFERGVEISENNILKMRRDL